MTFRYSLFHIELLSGAASVGHLLCNSSYVTSQFIDERINRLTEMCEWHSPSVKTELDRSFDDDRTSSLAYCKLHEASGLANANRIKANYCG